MGKEGNRKEAKGENEGRKVGKVEWAGCDLSPRSKIGKSSTASDSFKKLLITKLFASYYTY